MEVSIVVSWVVVEVAIREGWRNLNVLLVLLLLLLLLLLLIVILKHRLLVKLSVSISPRYLSFLRRRIFNKTRRVLVHERIFVILLVLLVTKRQIGDLLVL